MHNVLPHDFYGVPINDMARSIMVAFSDYEVVQHNKTVDKKKSKG